MNNPHWFENIENRPHPWPGLNWFTPVLIARNVRKAKNLYEKVFNFIPIFELENNEKELIFVRMRYRGCNFILQKEGEFNYQGKSPLETNSISPVMIYVYVDDVDKVYADSIENGFKSHEVPERMFWGDKKARIEDTYGYIWEIATKLND